MQCSGDFYSHRDRYTSKSIHPATEQELKMHLFFPVHLDQASLPKTQCTQTVLTISNTGAKQQASKQAQPFESPSRPRATPAPAVSAAVQQPQAQLLAPSPSQVPPSSSCITLIPHTLPTPAPLFPFPRFPHIRFVSPKSTRSSTCFCESTPSIAIMQFFEVWESHVCTAQLAMQLPPAPRAAPQCAPCTTLQSQHPNSSLKDQGIRQK